MYITEDSGKIFVDTTNTAAGRIQLNAKAVSHPLTIQGNGTKLFDYDGADTKILNIKAGTNVSVSPNITDNDTSITINVPTASSTVRGATIVYQAAQCTTFTTDSDTVTPLAVQKGAKMFSITRPQKKSPSETTTDKNIVRWDGTAGDVQDSMIKIEDVINSKDNSRAQVLSIPASDGKKMVYGYCTNQTDGTSFIGGLFNASTTSYPHNEGLAIGGSSGDLLWKGSKVLTVANGTGTFVAKTGDTMTGNLTVNTTITVGGASGVTLQYDTTNKCLNFNFA